MRRSAPALAAVTVVCALASQGSSVLAANTAPVLKPSDCLKQARDAIAHQLGVKVAAVRETNGVGSNGMQQCSYLVQRVNDNGPHTRAAVVVNIDNGPQAAWRLLRKVDEASQIFGPVPKGFEPPVGLFGLGPYASWFPQLHQLMVNNVNRKYILTVSIIWRHAKRAAMIGLARAAVRPYRRVTRFTSEKPS